MRTGSPPVCISTVSISMAESDFRTNAPPRVPLRPQRIRALRMTAGRRVGEGAERRDLLAGGASVFHRPCHQPQTDALPAKRVRHLGMVYDDHVLPRLGEGHLGHRAAIPKHITA